MSRSCMMKRKFRVKLLVKQEGKDPFYRYKVIETDKRPQLVLDEWRMTCIDPPIIQKVVGIELILK